VWNASGQMEIMSQPGAGTQIRVLLPIARDNTDASSL
jgi:signal transduction histidine kinase